MRGLNSMKYLPTHRQPLGALTKTPAKKSWDELLRDIAVSIPQAVATTKELTPSIKRLTPIAESVDFWIPWLTAGVFFLGTSLIIYTVYKVKS